MKSLWRRLLVAALVATALACLGAWLGLLWFESTYDQPYALVEDGLFIGKSVDQPPRGTQAVVNLCGRPDLYQVEAALCEPVFEAGQEPSLDWLRRVVGFIAEQRMNRSGAVVTAYLMQEHGWGRDEALAVLQKRRPEVQPNPILMRLLAEWEQVLMAERSTPPDPGS